MWHEGAIWLDAATRVEKRYLQQNLVLPHQAWNYPHNRNFLAHAQSMLGLPSAALQGSYDLLNAPLDPDENSDDGDHTVFGQGLEALRRTLVRFERWDAILEPGHIPWNDSASHRAWRAHSEGLAALGQGDLAAAEQRVLDLLRLGKEIEAGSGDPTPLFEAGDIEGARRMLALKLLEDLHPIMVKELEGRLRIARGEHLRGLELLTEAARLEFEHREEHDDPPTFPRSLYNVLGETYLELGSPRPAIAAFEKALESIPNNGYSWAGLARAHHALSEVDEAERCYAHMLHVWSGAEAVIWQLEKARALGLEVDPIDPSPAAQRSYETEVLAQHGPNTWQPYPAPTLVALDADRAEVGLGEFAGKNVLLVFYLSDQCVHCVEQLRAIEARAAEFAAKDTVLLAISADPPERNAASVLRDLPFRLLSDSPDHANAIRYKSFDEFEDIELHSTQLIDRQGRLRWVRTGGEPFTDIGFLLREIDRIESIDERRRLEPVGGG
jgi:peroxiredoxin